MIFLKSKNLASSRHGFFCRLGGVSESIYNSLNCGYSSSDDKQNVTKNRELILNKLNSNTKNLVIPSQYHSNKVKILNKEKYLYKCDGLINTHKGITLGVLTADCCPILISHKQKKLTGVIHAGWKGVRNGIIENFISKADKLGFKPHDLIFALGPCIGYKSYEVTKEFKNNFLKKYKKAKFHFKPKEFKNRFNFNLRGCIISILKSNNVSDIWASQADTYMFPRRYFSYRYSIHKGDKDYGRMLSVILS